MSAPTEEEIRAELVRAWATEPILSNFKGLADGLHDWDDMRRAEIARHDAIADEEFAEFDRLADLLRKEAPEASVRAELRFWAEHPDARAGFARFQHDARGTARRPIVAGRVVG
ncbi:MAG: hypothetical protein H0T59_10275 [Chloroflexi bacterium]|nr:hypothetical protein [Chloroflexota bacterium]